MMFLVVIKRLITSKNPFLENAENRGFGALPRHPEMADAMALDSRPVASLVAQKQQQSKVWKAEIRMNRALSIKSGHVGVLGYKNKGCIVASKSTHMNQKKGTIQVYVVFYYY
jgi:hypothetical protein